MQVFSSIFALECIIKVLALSKEYFNNGWNIFDFLIVLASMIDIFVELLEGLNILRSFRLVRFMRTFDLQSHHSFNVCIMPSECVYLFLSPFLSPFFFLVTSAEASSIMDNYESLIEHYNFNNWRSGKSYINLSYSDLYICRYWNAIVFERLHTRQILSGSSASVRLNQLIHTYMHTSIV